MRCLGNCAQQLIVLCAILVVFVSRPACTFQVSFVPSPTSTSKRRISNDVHGGIFLFPLGDNSGQESSNNPARREYFIRKAVPADLGTASKILADGFFGDCNFFTYQWEKFVTYLSLESDLSNKSKSDAQGPHVMLVACRQEDGQVVAICDVDNRSSLPRHQRPYMSNLAVCPSWRNQGIAKALVATCEAVVGVEWKETSLHLKARQNNEAAIGMYKSLGYEIQSETFDFTYMDQLVVMKKTIAVAPNDVKEEMENSAATEIPSNDSEGTKVVRETLVSSSSTSS